MFAPWFDYGYCPDPVAEFLGSLGPRSTRSGRSSSRCPGHGRALEDVRRRSADHRAGVADRLDATVDAVRSVDGARVHAITERVFGDLTPIAMVWRLTEIACYLRHLRLTGTVTREQDADGKFRYRA